MGTYMCQTLGNTSLAPRCQGHGMGAALQPQYTLQPLRPRGSTCSLWHPQDKAKDQGSFRL